MARTTRACKQAPESPLAAQTSKPLPPWLAQSSSGMAPALSSTPAKFSSAAEQSRLDFDREECRGAIQLADFALVAIHRKHLRPH